MHSAAAEHRSRRHCSSRDINESGWSKAVLTGVRTSADSRQLIYWLLGCQATLPTSDWWPAQRTNITAVLIALQHEMVAKSAAAAMRKRLAVKQC